MASARLIVILSLAAAATLPSAAASAAPKELYGKSIVISWTEDRVQRLEGQSDFTSRSVQGGLSIYISSAGNVFNRRSMTVATMGRGPRRMLDGSKDQVGSGGNSNVSFSGHTMTAVQTSENGARMITATFDASFSSCTADAIRGKAAGASSSKANSLIHPGQKVEIQSVKTSNVGCSIRDGNVFAGN